jgi:type IV pilus assembly protein PilQ
MNSSKQTSGAPGSAELNRSGARGGPALRRAILALGAFALVAGVAVQLGAPVQAQDRNLDRVAVESGDITRVVLSLSSTAEGSAVSTFKLNDPNRIVIDIANTTANLEVQAPSGDGVLVDRVEVVSFDDGQGLTTRITLTLNRSADDVQPQVSTEGGRVTVALPIVAFEDPVGDAIETASTPGVGATRELSGPDQLRSGKTLTSVDFQNLDEISRIVVGVKGTTEYSVSQPQRNLVVIDVPGTFLPQSLKRVLDTSEFFSAVRMVRAYSISGGTRVAVSLRTEAEFSHTITGEGLIVLDVKVPPSLREARQEAWSESGGVSPSRQGDGLGNATASEVYIGASGRTSSPAAMWGGSGALDPSGSFAGAAGFMFDQTSAGNIPFSGRRISLDFVNADIHSIFRLISHVSRLNIVAGDDVQGQVTVRMVDVPWDMALAAVLQAKGLGSQRFGNVVRVAPIESIKAEQQAAVEAKRAQEELTELDLLVVPLNYVQASEMSEQVAALLTSRGSVQVDQTSNQLVVKETERRLAQIRELIRYLDRQTPQVLIEGRIVEANSAFTKALGVEWGSELDYTTRTGYSTGLFFPNGVGLSGGLTQAGAGTFYTPGQDTLMVDLGAESANSGVAFSLGSIPGLINLDARLSALESDGWGKVVSQPRVTTLDNKTANISQGQRIPFLSTSAGGTNVQFIEAELELEVTPHITTDNKVFMNVKVTNNRADFSQLVQGQPAIQTKEVTTELLVADGDTTVMGGVFSTEHSYSQDRVPGFSKIPLIGYLFKNSAESLTRNELLVFLTPHIVTRPVKGSAAR